MRMKQYALLIMSLLLLMSSNAFAFRHDSHYALWHKYDHAFDIPNTVPPVARKKQPYQLPKQRFGRYSVHVYNGSLLANSKRILGRFGWHRVVWTVPYDFKWVGQTTLRGNNPQDFMRQILAGYPLQAVFYQGNRVVVIKPRILQ